LILPSCVYRQR